MVCQTRPSHLFSQVVASAVPVFGDLVNLIGASLGTPVCIQAFVNFPYLHTLLELTGRVPSGFGTTGATSPQQGLVCRLRLVRLHGRLWHVPHGRRSEC